MKHLANGITVSRMLFAAALLLVPAFSVTFWVLYGCGGFSDVLDGVAARALHQQSPQGAKLDSVADLLFTAAVLVTVARYLPLPVWIYALAGAAALLRIAAYLVGWHRYHTFCPLHTYANKATGLLLILSPVLIAAAGVRVAGGIACGAALLSGAEELIIMLQSKTLDRDRKSLL